MPSPPSHGLFSTSWKPGCAGSKLAQTISATRKVTSEVHKATLRLLRATMSGSPRISRMNATPTSGRNVTRESNGQSPMCSPDRHVEVPADQGRDPDQHDEGVVVDV